MTTQIDFELTEMCMHAGGSQTDDRLVGLVFLSPFVRPIQQQRVVSQTTDASTLDPFTETKH